MSPVREPLAPVTRAPSGSVGVSKQDKESARRCAQTREAAWSSATAISAGRSADAEILKVPHTDGSPPYRVRWSDTGDQSLFFRGQDACIDHLTPSDRNTEKAPG